MPHCTYRLKNHYPNIKLTIKVNPSKFWKPNSPTSMVHINSTFIGKTQNYLHHGPPKRYKRNTTNDDLYPSKRISSNFDKEIPLIKEKFMRADYPLRFINRVVNDF